MQMILDSFQSKYVQDYVQTTSFLYLCFQKFL